MTETDDRIGAYRGQLQAVELCRAVSNADHHAAEAMLAHVIGAGQIRELTAALANFAVSLARTVAATDDTLNEQAMWDGLASRAETGLVATHEIETMTTEQENDR